MPSDFNTLKQLYDSNQFIDLIDNPLGVYWLKLRSVSRAPQLRKLCQKTGIAYDGVLGRQLFEHVYNFRPSKQVLDDFIYELHEEQRKKRRQNEDYLVSLLYQMKVFDWGGLYQNNLEQTIVNNYIKRTQDWNDLNNAIENQIHASMRGYVQCSWYNHWTSILIEDIFKDNRAILPVVGQVKKVDFFVHDFPYDLKVTYFPDGYMQKLRKEEGLRPEFTELKAFCRKEKIWFDRDKSQRILFPELLAKISEHPSQTARHFITEFRATRVQLIEKTMKNPTALKVWLYENQGFRRFDAAGRFFLILINMENLEESWKLKRNQKLLLNAINSYLDVIPQGNIEELAISFNWQSKKYKTYADILFVVYP